MSSLTKAFIVLTLVFSVALAVLMVMEVGRMANYKENLTAAHAEAFAAQATLDLVRAQQQATQVQLQAAEKQVADITTQMASAATKANTDYTTLQNQEAQLAAQVQQLTAANEAYAAVAKSQTDQLQAKDTEISQIRPQITTLIQQNAELNKANNELANQNRSAEQAIRKLQEAISSNTGTGAATVDKTNGQVTQSTPGTPGVGATAAVNGRITHIGQSAGHTLIETKLGSSSGIAVNSKFMIYRQNGGTPVWIGDAVVANVSDDQSVATVTTTNDGQQPQAGDLVVTSTK